MSPRLADYRATMLHRLLALKFVSTRGNETCSSKSKGISPLTPLPLITSRPSFTSILALGEPRANLSSAAALNRRLQIGPR